MAHHFKPVLVAFCVAAGLAHGDMVTLKPPEGKSGANKVLIVINGAFVPNVDYIDVAKAVQAATDLNLWVAIPSFLLNTPNPGQIDSNIKSGISALTEAGFPGKIEGKVDVVVAGHSLGGIFSQSSVVKGDYAGLVLFGSYLSSYKVSNYPKPALTLAGEVDGLTRITRIAKSWSELQDLVAAKGDDALYTHPVIALPGVSHSQFCSNVNVTSFGMKDKCPEVSLKSAHSAIGSAVDAFLTTTFASGDVAAAKAKLDSGRTYTEGLLAGYLQAFESTKAGGLCAYGQQKEVNTSKTAGSVKVTSTSNFASFSATNPSIDGTNVMAVQEVKGHLNPTDLSTIDMSAPYVNCKMKTAAALADNKGSSAPAQDSNTCRSVNDDTILRALNLVSANTKARYLNTMKPLTTKDDVVYSTGITWQAASFNFDTSGAEAVAISSPRLTSGLHQAATHLAGDQLCKYLTPDRVIEYMMVDGLHAFDECPQKSEPANLIV